MTALQEKPFNSSGKHSETKECDSIARPCWQVMLLGFATGIGGALIGVGGGIIMIPVMTIWGLTQKRAQGTSLAVIVALVPVAIATYALKGNIDYQFAVPLAVGGIIGSLAGSQLALRFSNRILTKLFAGFLIVIALRLFFDIAFGQSGNSVSAVESNALELTGVGHYIESTLFGALAGMAAGFFGVGGGVVFVPTGRLLAGLGQAVAQGSSLTAMLPTSLVAMINYHRKREIDWNIARWMIPGAWLGAVLGAIGADILGKVRDGNILTAIFAVFLMITGVRRLLAGNTQSSGNAGESNRENR